jgi:hypothetical protein
VMGINQKFRTLSGAADGAKSTAEQALQMALSCAIFHEALVKAAGYEVVHDPAPGKPGYVTTRYRRKLPKWLAWVRRIGVWR